MAKAVYTEGLARAQYVNSPKVSRQIHGKKQPERQGGLGGGEGERRHTSVLERSYVFGETHHRRRCLAWGPHVQPALGMSKTCWCSLRCSEDGWSSGSPASPGASGWWFHYLTGRRAWIIGRPPHRGRWSGASGLAAGLQARARVSSALANALPTGRNASRVHLARREPQTSRTGILVYAGVGSKKAEDASTILQQMGRTWLWYREWEERKNATHKSDTRVMHVREVTAQLWSDPSSREAGLLWGQLAWKQTHQCRPVLESL